MLDRANYSRDWRERVAGYRTKNLVDCLVTTDDLAGVRQERLRQVIADLVTDVPAVVPAVKPAMNFSFITTGCEGITA